MAVTCPKCKCVLEVRLTAAPPMQSQSREADGEIGALLSQIDDAALNDWEADFIGKLRERYAQYGERVLLSDKQRGILDKIASGKR
jgi:hypothetical protein